MARRPVQPTVLRKLHGNPKKKPYNEHEPMPAHPLGEAPSWFDDDAREVWDYAAKHAPPGLLTTIDAGIFGVWCIAESLHRKAYESLVARGRLVIRDKFNRAGTRVAEIDIIRDQARIMLKAGMELGFTPTARPKIKVMKGLASMSPSLPEDAADPNAGKNLEAYLSKNPDRYLN